MSQLNWLSQSGSQLVSKLISLFASQSVSQLINFFFLAGAVRARGSDGHKRLWFSVEQNCKAVKERKYNQV